jgi:hypothetical protein
MQQARDIMTHGMFTKTFAHYFDKSDPVEKIFIIGLFENLIEESIYEFECEQQSIELDFSESEYDPDELDINTGEEGTAVISFPQPTDREVRALALLEASVDEIKMLKANSDIFEDNMRSESATKVATTEEGRIGETYDEVNEHYLNLPYSRLVKDHKENLKRGGVDIEGVEAQDDIETVKRSFDAELPTGDDFETESTQDDATKEIVFVDGEDIEDEIEEE